MPRLKRLCLVVLTVGLASCGWMPASPTQVIKEMAAPQFNVPVVAATPAPTPASTPAPAPTPASEAPPTPTAPAPPKAPKPAPTDSQACPVPSQIRVKVHLPNGPNGSVMDSVALACGREACAGFKNPDGTTRQCCPLGPEGSERRGQCENEMVPDGPSWQVRGGSDRDHPTNPWLHFVHPPASVRACLPQGVCSDWLSVH